MTFTHKDGKKHSKHKILDSFAAIMVRVIGFKDLYEAWESQVRSEFENFKESGDAEESFMK